MTDEKADNTIGKNDIHPKKIQNMRNNRSYMRESEAERANNSENESFMEVSGFKFATTKAIKTLSDKRASIPNTDEEN